MGVWSKYSGRHPAYASGDKGVYRCAPWTDNPLLKRPIKQSDVKPLAVGHWGTMPGENFIYVHLNRVIKKYDLDMLYIAGPGHGGPALVGNTYLEGTYSEIYPDITQDEAAMIQDKLIEHKVYIGQHGEDMPEIRNWKRVAARNAKNSKPRAKLAAAHAR